MTTTCTHPNLTALGAHRCNAFQHCPTCGWESEAPGHMWVPAGMDPDDPKVCAYCDAERSTSNG